MLGDPKTKSAKDGSSLHFSVGAIIKKNDKYLLIDRVNVPFGFAALAGHVDEGEDAPMSIKREVKEESGLIVKDARLVAEDEVSGIKCVYGASLHRWYIFECDTESEPNQSSEEAKSIKWYTVEEIKKLKLEPSWDYWFKKLNII